MIVHIVDYYCHGSYPKTTPNKSQIKIVLFCSIGAYCGSLNRLHLFNEQSQLFQFNLIKINR